MAKISFSADIRPLFRSFDVDSMKPNGLDLSSFEDVKKNAQKIYAALVGKEMPCDEPWKDPDVQKLKEWIDGGMLP